MDTIYQSVVLASAASYLDPEITGTVTTSSTNDTITLSNLELSSGNGYFYAIADQGSLIYPTYSLIRAKQNATKYTIPGANAHYTGTPTSLTIKGLAQNSTYHVYYYASNEDLSGYGKVIGVEHVLVTTKPTEATKYQTKIASMFGLLIMILLVLVI